MHIVCILADKVNKKERLFLSASENKITLAGKKDIILFVSFLSSETCYKKIIL
ncbi:hypothetical protein II5_05952 [Bacillus cereus MSX-A1]|nr:hypothetical protein II5_05952 [Bacillus cereus MSX-A1]